MVAGRLSPEHEVWLAFGTGKNFRYLSAHQIAVFLGPGKSLALPIFHALTGCDTVSGFIGHGKKTAWSTWNAFPELTDALLELAHVPTEVTEQIMKVIEGSLFFSMTEQSLVQMWTRPGRRCLPKHHLCKGFHQHMLLWSSI